MLEETNKKLDQVARGVAALDETAAAMNETLTAVADDS
jgi:hypothetical protein